MISLRCYWALPDRSLFIKSRAREMTVIYNCPKLALRYRLKYCFSRLLVLRQEVFIWLRGKVLNNITVKYDVYNERIHVPERRMCINLLLASVGWQGSALPLVSSPLWWTMRSTFVDLIEMSWEKKIIPRNLVVYRFCPVLWVLSYVQIAAELILITLSHTLISKSQPANHCTEVVRMVNIKPA